MNIKKLGLCLSGGGGKGAYQIGVWQALREFGLDYNISAISGTSVGGLNGVMIAQNKFNQAKSIWLNIESRNMLSIQDVPSLATRLTALTAKGAISPLIAHFIRTKGLFKQDGLKSMINEGLDTQLLTSSILPLTVALHNTEANRVDYHQINNPHTAANMLLGTAALPLIFDDVRINGSTYSDGGFYWGLPQKRLDNTPILPLIESGCDTIIVALLSPDDLSINPRHYPGVRILPIVPTNNLGGLTATLDFSNEGAARRMEQGYLDAAQIFRHLNLFLENEAQYEALWQRVQLTAEQERRHNEDLLNIEKQHQRTVHAIHDFDSQIAKDDFQQPLELADEDLPQALDHLSLENTSLLADIERRQIETAVSNFIACNENNKRAIENAALDALAALAPTSGRATHLIENNALSRLWDSITGKNLRISAENDRALAQAQYAALRLIAAVQEKGAITLEFACTLQNRINGAFSEIERLGERHNRDLHRVYHSLASVYSKLRDRLNTQETRLDALERSDRLQNWLLHPNQPRLNGKTLDELPPVLRLCCLANDFFRITGANWQISELNSLREMCINVGLDKNHAVSIADFCEQTCEKSTYRQALTANLAILPDTINPNSVTQWLRGLRSSIDNTDSALALASWGYDANTSLPAWDFLIELLYHLKAGGFTVVGSSDIAQYKAHWLEQLYEIEQLIDEEILPRSFGKELQRLRESIDDFHPKVLLIGKFSVGKSTLINCWLGQEIQLHDLGACTSLATEFHYIEPGQEKLVACWLENSKNGLIRREELPLSVYPACLDRWHDLGQQPLYIEIHLSNQALARHPDLVLVDTPGLGSGNGLHERAIQQYIGEAVSSILCVNRASQVGIDELAFIDRQRSLGQDFSILVCQEALSNPSERQALRQSLASQAGLDMGIPVPGCSAVEGDLSGFQDVLARLENRKADLFRRSFASALDKLLKQAEWLIRQQLASDTTADQLQDKKEQIGKELASLKENFKQEQDILLRDCRGSISCQIVETVSNYLRGRRQAYARMLLGGQGIGPLLTADARNACQLAIEQHLTPRFLRACKELESEIDVGAFNGPSLEGNGPVRIEVNSNFSSAAAGTAAGAAIGSMIPLIGTVIGGLIGGVLGLFASRSRKESEAESKAQEAIELVVGCLRNSLPETVGTHASLFLTKVNNTLETRIAAKREILTRIEQQLTADTELKEQIGRRAEQALTRISGLIETQAATLEIPATRENHVT